VRPESGMSCHLVDELTNKGKKFFLDERKEREVIDRGRGMLREGGGMWKM